MSMVRIIAIILIAAGLFGLVAGSFSYTKDSQAAKLGPLELSIKDKETVPIPAWAGIAAVIVGVGLLFVGGKRG